MPDRDPTFSRRSALTSAVRGAGILVAGGALASLAAQRDNQFVWQIDPYKCIQCGKCATECVLSPSAVKCLNVFPICGYCRRCTGYFVAWTDSLNEGRRKPTLPHRRPQTQIRRGRLLRIHRQPRRVHRLRPLRKRLPRLWATARSSCRSTRASASSATSAASPLNAPPTPSPESRPKNRISW